MPVNSEQMDHQARPLLLLASTMNKSLRGIASICLAVSLLPAWLGAAELKTTYQINSYPKYILIARNGGYEGRGLCFEIMKAVDAQLMKIRIRPDCKALPFKRILHALEAGQIDIFFGMARNQAREERFNFIPTPIYDVHYMAAVRGDDKINVQSFEEIRKLGPDGLILTNIGTAAERFLKSQPGLLIDASGKDIPQNLMKLANGRGRFYIFHDIGLVGTIGKDYPQGQFRVLEVIFRSYHHYIGLSKHVGSDLAARIDAAVKQLRDDGTLKAIRQKYATE